MKGKLPDFYYTLTEDQQKRRAYLPELPEVYWVADNGRAYTRPAARQDTMHPPPGSPYYVPGLILSAWKGLAKLGYIPTTRENYAATGRRMHKE